MIDAAFDVAANDAVQAAQRQARQDTQQDRAATVVDACGRQLRAGDLVLVRCTVECVNPDGYGCNVVLRTVESMPATDRYGPHKSPVHLHSRQCVLVERGAAKKPAEVCQCPRDDARLQSSLSKMLGSSVTCLQCGLPLKTE